MSWAIYAVCETLCFEISMGSRLIFVAGVEYSFLKKCLLNKGSSHVYSIVDYLHQSDLCVEQ